MAGPSSYSWARGRPGPAVAAPLDGRVLRSRGIDGLDQEVHALLTAHQA
ncbi:hypothetical protein [Streptomyces sp. NPDC003667]